MLSLNEKSSKIIRLHGSLYFDLWLLFWPASYSVWNKLRPSWNGGPPCSGGLQNVLQCYTFTLHNCYLKNTSKISSSLIISCPQKYYRLLQIFSQAVAPKITPLLESIAIRWFFSLKCKMIVHWLSKISSSPQDITGLLEIFVAPKITPLLEISHFTASHCTEVNEKKTWHRHF